MSKPWQFKRQQVILAHGDDDDAASVCSEVSDFDPSQISDPTLQQQALQSQQDLRSGATARKHSLQTVALIDAMWKNWQLWAVSASLGDPVRLLRKGAKNSAVFMAFLQFYHDKHKVGRAESYKNYWKRVKQVYVREVQTDLPTKISGEISNWFLNTFYSRNDVQRKRRDRQVLDHRSLFAALHYLWTFDTTVYTIERNRIQLATVLLWLAYTGVRPGSLILSTSKKDCDAEYTLGKRAIRYEDVSLYLLRTPGCDPVLAMQIRVIQQKGEQERSAPPSVFSFFENRSCPVMCPILPFLALAFADKAFHPSLLEAGLGPQNIHSFSSRYGSERMKFDWNEQMLKTPIFRAKRHGLNGAEVDPYNPINTGNISQWFGSLCEQAGFEKGLCPYTIRRGVGTKLTDQGIASERRNQIMGHSRSSIFEQWYQDHKIAVDVQAAFLEESSRPELMASLARQCLRLDPDLPRSLSDQQRAEAHATPTIKRLQAEVDKLGLQLSNDWGSVAKGRDREPEKADRRDKLQNEIKSLRVTASRNFLKKLQTDFHNQADLSAMVEQLEGKKITKRFLLRPEYALSERRNLSQLLAEENIDDATFATIVRSMSELSLCREGRHRALPIDNDSCHDAREAIIQPALTSQPRPAKALSVNKAGMRKGGKSVPDSLRVTMVAAQADSSDPKPMPEPVGMALLTPPLQGERTTTDQFASLTVTRPRTKLESQQQRHKRRPTIKKKLCLFCGHQSRDFSTVSSLIRHYRNTHFRFVTGEFYCPREDCRKVIRHPDAFARHATEAHGADMGKRASLVETKTARKPRQQMVVFN